ncbi:Phosphoinositide 3-Phosphatase [Klebsormidium nitens]|uniref:Phosphoinositide 3-Phosphatase n=1 Tax=Klebsormidium nitens TaxID=105231 RepID=A0A1Y1HM14_KLENI|nr:Phosphoinositide 3-Phosphatase [Klebsormidium nitens]|eukprot:GAQ79654.1 Phosphoinositide 3-Phosphatase [Klebsormidium nitens]
MDPGQALSSGASELRPVSAAPAASGPAISVEGQSPSSEAALPESFSAGSAELSSSDQSESGLAKSESEKLHAGKTRPKVALPKAVSGQKEGSNKGTTLLDAGAQAFGSVRAVVAKNLAALQATRDAEKKVPNQTAKAEPSLTTTHSTQSTESELKGHATEGKSMTSSDASEKQSFGSGLNFASLGSRFQSLKQTAVKAVSQPVRHLVSQNKRRYMDGEYDLDLSYITENIIAMGFPAGDLSSGLFGYVEGFYRNHMEEVVRFLDAHHKGKCKIFNLCSERLYDSALFEGLVACFPFDDHNCPPLPLLKTFCDSAYDWLKRDMNNMVVVHCKAGKSRTGLMICCLLLYLKLFDSADEAIKFYNSKRCTDNLGLTLPSQIRYVHYFESILRNGGDTPAPEARILRGIRLHKCPYWIRPAISVLDHDGVIFSTKKHPRTKDLATDDLWHKAPRKGVMVFALPGERCVADLSGDFKVLFHDRHGDFYCWLNTSMIGTRQFLEAKDLDWFDKRRLPSPGFQVEVVVLDPATQAARAESNAAATTSEPDAPEPLAPRRLDGPTGFGTLTGSARGGPGEGTNAEAEKGSSKGSGKGGRLKTTKEREEDEVFGESEEEPSPRIAATSVPAHAPPLGTLTAHLTERGATPSSAVAEAPSQSVRETPPEKPGSALGTLPRPAPPTDAATPSATEPSSSVKTASDSGPSTAGPPAPQEAANGVTSVVPTSNLHHASPAQSSAPKVGASADSAAAVDTSASKDRKGDAGSSTQAEVSKSDIREPLGSSGAASVKPSVASSLLADDWEADVFGAEDASISRAPAASGGLDPGKTGAAALSSDFAKMAVAGSANASEFTLGDDDDFDSDEGF